MFKKVIINIAKLLFAGGLLYWLFSSGKLDFSLLGKMMDSPIRLGLSIGLMFIVLFIVAIRWRILLEGKAKESLPIGTIFRASWIGAFFNQVIPGSVSGDMIKIFYVEKLSSTFKKSFLLSSVFIDRLLGLFALISLGGIFAIINYSTLTGLSTDVKNLTHINLLLFAIVVLSLLLIFKFEGLPILISKKVKEAIPPTAKILDKLEEVWEKLCSFKKGLLKIYLLGIVVQGMAIGIFWFLTSPFAEGELSITMAYTVLPICFVAMAIPIAPGGLGVGHAVFHTVLGYIGVTNGASLFNLYFFVVVFYNLSGALPYLTSKTSVDIKDDAAALN